MPSRVRESTEPFRRSRLPAAQDAPTSAPMEVPQMTGGHDSHAFQRLDDAYVRPAARGAAAERQSYVHRKFLVFRAGKGGKGERPDMRNAPPGSRERCCGNTGKDRGSASFREQPADMDSGAVDGFGREACGAAEMCSGVKRFGEKRTLPPEAVLFSASAWPFPCRAYPLRSGGNRSGMCRPRCVP